MPSTFPGTLDSFTDPLSNSPLNSPSHSTLHSDINDAVEKVEQYMGLVKVIPTGATNGTVGATGTVTIGNAVSSVTVSGAFSSLYDAYKVVITGGAASGDCVLYLQLGSTTTGYYTAFNYVTFSSATTARADGNNNGANFINMGAGTANNLSASIEIQAPFLTKRTTVQGFGGFGNTYIGTTAGVVDNTTSYTAFTILPNTGTLTGGSIRVYGYRN